MAQNVRRQAMDLPKLIEDFGSDAKCREYLEDLRWPDGVVCPRCQGTKISRIGWNPKPGKKGRYQYDCGSCRYRFSPTVDTIFHDSHLPLWKWFLATYLMIESKKGISANQLKRTLRVADKTAWFLTHRIRAAMRDDEPLKLHGTVEVDETFIGGKNKGDPGGRKNKTMVVGAIERGGKVRVRAERSEPTRAVLEAFIKSAVSNSAKNIYTDSAPGYRRFGKIDPRHDQVDHTAEEYVRGDVHTNTVENAWSLLKRSIVGSYHKLSVEHLPAYLDEFTFRFNGRNNPFLFRDTLLRLIDEEPLTYKELTHSSTPPGS